MATNMVHQFFLYQFEKIINNKEFSRLCLSHVTLPTSAKLHEISYMVLGDKWLWDNQRRK